MKDEDFNRLASEVLEDDIDNIELDRLLSICDEKHKNMVKMLRDLYDYGFINGQQVVETVDKALIGEEIVNKTKIKLH